MVGRPPGQHLTAHNHRSTCQASLRVNRAVGVVDRDREVAGDIGARHRLQGVLPQILPRAQRLRGWQCGDNHLGRRGLPRWRSDLVDSGAVRSVQQQVGVAGEEVDGGVCHPLQPGVARR
ncbi:hypothetical protein GWK47_020830 [Chionoecetes opilio]|uniref:Uncharacterized protein n=1 Tax=Chionoecetes opilio TaxID=41210 RepID=A0A8J4XXZ0_CHIOP|nr:hypothetical protein GWK47_020830 [Chionoecetes opilio]